jgi:hypothetical protein
MKNSIWLKWLWIFLFVATMVYSINNYIETGFSWGTIAQLAIVLGVGPSVFYKKPPQ